MKFELIRSLIKNRALIKFFFQYQRKYYSIAITIGILMLIHVLLNLPMPLVTMYIIDNVIPAGDFAALNKIFLVLLAVIIMAPLSGYLYRYFTFIYNARVNFDLERDLYGHVQRLPMRYFARRSSGYILSRIGEISAVEAIMADTLFNIGKDILMVIVTGVIAVMLHFELGLISVISLPFFVLSIKAFHKKLKEINIKLKEERAQYTGKLETNINSIEKIKSSVKEEKVLKRLSQKLSNLIKIRIRAQLISAVAGIVAAFVGSAAPFIIAWYGLSQVMSNDLKLGAFFAISSFMGYLLGPARNLTNVGFTISQAMAGLERIYEVFKEKEEDTGGIPIDGVNEIVFDKVDFSYDGNHRVLKELDLRINSGEKIALVGQSGQGKSTLVKMIMKFYEPDEGNIYFSGLNSKEINIKSLRERIAYVSQKQKILEEELEENVDENIVRKMLKKFKVNKEIDSQNLYQTEFSGGEIQKIELMESILKEADILIVDEGTSNIDYNSEKIVMDELFDRYSDKIIIFIAHRLSSITDFERILVIHDGRVVEDGTHDKLIQNNGKYRFLWGNQADGLMSAQKNQIHHSMPTKSFNALSQGVTLETLEKGA